METLPLQAFRNFFSDRWGGIRMILNIVMSNGWTVMVKRDASQIYDEIVSGDEEYIEVEDIHGSLYCLNHRFIVCAKVNEYRKGKGVDE